MVWTCSPIERDGLDGDLLIGRQGYSARPSGRCGIAHYTGLGPWVAWRTVHILDQCGGNRSHDARREDGHDGQERDSRHHYYGRDPLQILRMFLDLAMLWSKCPRTSP